MSFKSILLSVTMLGLSAGVAKADFIKFDAQSLTRPSTTPPAIVGAVTVNTSIGPVSFLGGAMMLLGFGGLGARVRARRTVSA